jgi:hypothetical protein
MPPTEKIQYTSKIISERADNKGKLLKVSLFIFMLNNSDIVRKIDIAFMDG